MSHTFSTTMPDGTLVEVNITPAEVAPVSDPQDAEPHFVTFIYDGYVRVVQNPTIIRGAYLGGGRYNSLLAGVEVEKGGFATSGEYKQFSLTRIDALG